MLHPGQPATLTLLAIIAGAWLVGARSAQGDDDQQLRAHTMSMGITAAVYWVWAIYNNATSSFDAGIISFSCALFAALATHRALAQSPPDARALRKLRAGSPLACSLVVANYAFVVRRTDDWLRVYVLVAMAAWVGFTLGGAVLLHRHVAALEEARMSKPLLTTGGNSHTTD